METQAESYKSGTPIGSNQSPIGVELEHSQTPTLSTPIDPPRESPAESPVQNSNEILVDDSESPNQAPDANVGVKRKLTFVVWDHFKKIKINGEDKVECNYCHKKIGSNSKNGTTHLHDHYKTCPRRCYEDIRQHVLVKGQRKADGKWKSNGIKYPTLQKIAKDILAIPISTVASEFAFSTGGRSVSPHHSRLHVETLEALMCAQNCLLKQVQGVHSKVIDAYYHTIEYDSDVDEISETKLFFSILFVSLTS
ncbi:PREDICTED: uncharacterized protein LOC104610671 [Nelumbo nucifera]|uniref:Uncharacterized protein LOC104610671 n=1 Tax=Nelumbo nucifera TaxID=4432 RepID=A0A1U8B7Y7_NELNU|nr:PREDICTED: uncharacterized protein LOC104610671 [Nelumbo nucifera]